MKKIFTTLFFILCCVCSADEPIAVYLTWTEKPDTTMSVHWISHENGDLESISYREIGEIEWKEEEALSHPLPEGNQNFLVYTAKLTSLRPESGYEFLIGHTREIRKFRTMPEEIKKPLRFVVGGDMYHDFIEVLDETNKAAAKFAPLFVIAGGDLAYAADKFGRKPEDFFRWMEFLHSWEKNLVTPNGYLVPILPTTSNEDTKGRYNQTPEQAPFFYSLFSMPGPNGYNVLDFGDYLSLLLLDSGHTHPIYGEQTKWLDESLSTREHVPHKFAAYHVPAYPGYRDPDLKYSSLIRMHWVPLFEKYGLNVAFEHHDHTYKRTVLIKKGKEDPQGVLYLGDGGWGVSKPRIPKRPEDRWYLAYTACERHFIVVTLYPDGSRRFQAINSEGKIFDEVFQN